MYPGTPKWMVYKKWFQTLWTDGMIWGGFPIIFGLTAKMVVETLAVGACWILSIFFWGQGWQDCKEVVEAKFNDHHLSPQWSSPFTSIAFFKPKDRVFSLNWPFSAKASLCVCLCVLVLWWHSFHHSCSSSLGSDPEASYCNHIVIHT